MPTPEDYASERLAARAAKYREEVARLRKLAATPPTDTYLAARSGLHTTQTSPEEDEG